MSSLFARLYTYRERKDRHKREDFLTEIFAFCLETDDAFFASLMNTLGIDPSQKMDREIYTQSIDPESKLRPDIQITFDDIHIIIECKVEDKERDNQLKDYQQILFKSEYPEKHLVFLTKYYEKKDAEEFEVPFHQLRWFQIFDLINPNAHLVTEQLMEYLQDQKLNSMNDFNYLDLVALQNITNSTSKMNEVLDQAKTHFENSIDNIKISQSSARSTSMVNNMSYRDYIEFISLDDYKYWINYGFHWNTGETVYLYLGIWLPKGNNIAGSYQRFFEQDIEGFDKTEDKKGYWLGLQRPLTSFFEEPDQVDTMTTQLKEWIDQISALAERNPKKFGLGK